MTLVARARPPAYHKKVSGNHHRRSKSYSKTYWPYLPLLAIVVLGAIFNSALPGKHPVLGYATDMSTQSLLNDTNVQREDDSESDLTLNTQLDSAAQTKANDMAARDYWSHNTPDGQTPWSFMTAAGYNYQLAGENLAYGFATASDTLTGWMNSPEHKANILNAGYKDVGFGFVNIVNYQNSGPQTLVVAMYGAQATTVPASVATVPPQTTKPSATSAASQTTTATPAAQTPVTTQTDVVTPAAQQAVLGTSKPQTVTRVQVLTAGKAPWSLFVLSLLGSAALIAFLLRHGLAWHKIFVKGERLLLHHPWLDSALVAIVMLAFALVHQAGVIR